MSKIRIMLAGLILAFVFVLQQSDILLYGSYTQQHY